LVIRQKQLKGNGPVAFINVGAKNGSNDVKTKKELVALVNGDDPWLSFYGTSNFTPFNGGLKEIDGSTVLSVVGPNPYTSRKWYATVRRENGKITVK